MEKDLKYIQNFFIVEKNNKNIQELQNRFTDILNNAPGNSRQLSSLLQSTKNIIQKFKDQKNNKNENIKGGSQKYKERMHNIKNLRKNRENEIFENSQKELKTSISLFQSAVCKLCVLKKEQISEQFSEILDNLNLQNMKYFEVYILI